MMIENLESRRMMSVSAVQTGGTVVVLGDNNGDTIAVTEFAHYPGYGDGFVQVASLDRTDPWLFTNVCKIILLTGNGADNLTINIQDANTYVDAGNGADTILFSVNGDEPQVSGDTAFVLADTFSRNSVYGGNGDDNITVIGARDSIVSGGNGNDFISVTNGQSNATVGSGTPFGGENVTVSGGNGNDTLVVTSVTCSIIAGDNGADRIIVSNSSYTLILGGNGNDTIEDDFGNHNVIDGGNGHDIIIDSTSTGDFVICSSGGDVIN